jgi:hypothetical protein
VSHVGTHQEACATKANHFAKTVSDTASKGTYRELITAQETKAKADIGVKENH